MNKEKQLAEKMFNISKEYMNNQIKVYGELVSVIDEGLKLFSKHTTDNVNENEPEEISEEQYEENYFGFSIALLKMERGECVNREVHFKNGALYFQLVERNKQKHFIIVNTQGGEFPPIFTTDDILAKDWFAAKPDTDELVEAVK